jgi:hypothetical protein
MKRSLNSVFGNQGQESSEEKESNSISCNEVYGKISNIESHLINFILTFQGAHELREMQACVKKFSTLLGKPMSIETGSIRSIFTEMKKEIEEFRKDAASFNVSALVEEISGLKDNIIDINKRLELMERFGIEKRVSLRVDVGDGDITVPKYSGVTIDDLCLSVRSERVLREIGIRGSDCVSEIAKLSELDILKVRNAGKKTLKEIQGHLWEYGLRLGMMKN